MLIIPAIDLQDGAVVRLVQGKYDKKVYSRDPLKTAKHWIKSGAEMLHVVDLDGAYSGIPANLSVVKEIVQNVEVPVEFGGGVRSMDIISELVDIGVSRVVLGTKAVEDETFLKKAFKQFKEKIIVGIDAKADKIQIKGWQNSSAGMKVLDFALELKELGFKEVIYTDTLKDGTLLGPNLKGIKSFLQKTGLKVVGSGGVSSLDDIRRLKQLEKNGLSGVIVGKALYEGRFTLPQALKLSS